MEKKLESRAKENIDSFILNSEIGILKQEEEKKAQQEALIRKFSDMNYENSIESIPTVTMEESTVLDIKDDSTP